MTSKEKKNWDAKCFPREKVDELMNRAVSEYMPGASLLMARQGFVYAKGYGCANVAEKTTATLETKYMVASVTKQFTCLAIMRLAKDGLLSLSDKVSRHFPELPSWAGEIEIRNLMNHTSGIPDYFDEAFIEKYCYEDPDAVAETLPLEIIASYDRLLFAPGTEHLYSNSGYVLLGVLVERLAGRSFASFANERVLRPAGMTNSCVLETGKRPDGLAVGYAGESGHYRPLPFNRGVVGWADGNLCSTVRDLYQWHLSLLSEAFLDADDARALFSPAVLPDGRRTGAGLGWFVGDRGGLREIWHTGSTIGFTSRISRFISFSDEAKNSPDAAVVFLCNMETAQLDKFSALFGSLVHLLLDDLIQKTGTEPFANAGLLKKFAGHYASSLDEEIRCDVTIAEGGLLVKGALRGFKGGEMVDYIGQGKDGEHRFALMNGADFIVGFDGTGRMYADSNGRMTYLVLQGEEVRA